MPKHADDLQKELTDEPLPTASGDLPRTRATAPPSGLSMSFIDASTGDLAQMANDSWGALQRANDPPVVFHHATGLGWVERTPDGTPVIRTLDHDRLRYRLARVASFFKYNRKGDVIFVIPPSPVVRDLLACPNPPLPRLKHLVAAPYMTASGALHLEPGYCSESSLYYAPSGVLEFPPISKNPNAAQVREAIQVMKEPLVDFPFAGPAEYAHALAYKIALFLLEQTHGPIPALAIDKPLRGSGASLLTDVILWPALGRPAPKMTEASDEAEWARTITAKLRNGSPIGVIDNIRERLESAALMSAISEAVREDRVIRTSLADQMSARTVWVLTGNNLRMSDEMIRRVLRCRLDPKVERPECRTGFQIPDLRAWLPENRGREVHAILTVCQAWNVAGKPLSRKELGGFEHFCHVIGGVLDFVEIPGFLENRNEVSLTVDLEEQAWNFVSDVWYERFGTRAVGVSELWDMLKVHPDTLIAIDLGSRGEDSQKSCLGLRLRARRDRVINGRRLRLAGTAHGVNRWYLESI
jgi:hypothetical protein